MSNVKDGLISTVSFIPRHKKYLDDVKKEVGISKAETIRRALDQFIGSDQDPLKVARNEEKENSNS
jgi:hypothetical protein